MIRTVLCLCAVVTLAACETDNSGSMEDLNDIPEAVDSVATS